MKKSIKYLSVISLLACSMSAMADDNFDGLYLGVGYNYLSGSVHNTNTLKTVVAPGLSSNWSTTTDSSNSGLVGLLGYGFQLGMFYLGTEFDYSHLINPNSDTVTKGQGNQSGYPAWYLSGSVLPGIVLGHNWLLFGRLGLNGTDLNIDTTVNGLNSTSSNSSSVFTGGYQVGAGLAYSITPHFNIRAEDDRVASFGESSQFDWHNLATTSSSSFNQVMVSLNLVL